MITCYRHHLEARCRERGYTLEEAAGCIVSQRGDFLVVDPDHPAYPRPKDGLGDKVERALKSVGITQDRVSRVLGRPCGCNERKQLLNRLGERVGIGRTTPPKPRNK